MTEHPRARLARLLDLGIAYDRNGLNRPEFLTWGMKPAIAGTWTVYRFRELQVLTPSVFTGLAQQGI
jgi:hypothetical protein